EQRIVGRLAYFRQQPTLTDRLRHIVVIALEAERSRHPATARVDHVVLHAHSIEQLSIAIHPEQRLLVTMAVDERARAEPHGWQPIDVRRQEFTEGKHLRAESLRARISGKQVDQLVAEHRQTTWLEGDDRDAGIDLAAESLENFLE